MLKPFLKWAGGKFKLVDRIKSFFPEKLNRYFEPFLGAGSVALNVDAEEIVVNDKNRDLFLVWSALKEKKNLVEECRKLFVPENSSKENYYGFRKEFNETLDDFRKAVLFVYLNRHCFNGLCRYNTKGQFNVPQGKYSDVYFPQKEFERASPKLEQFQIHNNDFREIFKDVKAGDVVYCDPPYVPISNTSNFTAYSSGGFSFQDQTDLAALARSAADRGATVLISNHSNSYSEGLYAGMGASINVFQVSRNINSKTSSRKPVEELIAVFNGSYENTDSHKPARHQKE